MEKDKITFKGFLKCFKNFDFNILTKPKREVKLRDLDSVQDSISHVTKMLQKAKRDLAKAYKSHKAGKMSIEEVFDYEWHVEELEQELRNIEDLNREQ